MDLDHLRSEETKEFLDSINEVMKSARKNIEMVDLQFREENNEKVFFLEIRKEAYPLQLFDSFRRYEANSER